MIWFTMAHCISVWGCVDLMKCYALQTLMRNFLLVGISEVTLVKLICANTVRTSAVQDIRVATLFVAICELSICGVERGRLP
jgi:hypothetical protein